MNFSYEDAMRESFKKFMEKSDIVDRMIMVEGKMYLLIDCEKELGPLIRSILDTYLNQGGKPS